MRTVKIFLISISIVFIILLICFSFYSVITFFSYSNLEVEQYPWGRDTIYQFGDGKYGIYQYPDRKNDIEVVKKHSFENVEDGTTLEWEVYSYCDMRPYAYIIGKKGYLVINYETEEIIVQEDTIENIPKAYQEVFELSKKFKDLNGI
jgi:hypothetical protein